MSDHIICQSDLFDGFSESQLNLLNPLFNLCECEADQVIFEQGDVANHLYIIVEGSVVIRYKPDDGPALDVARLKVGEVFGWSAAFGSGFYTSGTVCVSPSRLLCVRGIDLKLLRENHPETGILILERLAKLVAKRLKGTHHYDQILAFLEHGLVNGIKPIGG